MEIDICKKKKKKCPGWTRSVVRDRRLTGHKDAPTIKFSTSDVFFSFELKVNWTLARNDLKHIPRFPETALIITALKIGFNEFPDDSKQTDQTCVSNWEQNVGCPLCLTNTQPHLSLSFVSLPTVFLFSRFLSSKCFNNMTIITMTLTHKCQTCASFPGTEYEVRNTWDRAPSGHKIS